MRHAILAAGLLLLVAAGEAFAQGQNSTVGRSPSLQPTVSPYINLRRGATAGINYFGIVRPQQEMQRDIGRLENRIQQDESTAAADQGTTGRRASHGYATAGRCQADVR